MCKSTNGVYVAYVCDDVANLIDQVLSDAADHPLEAVVQRLDVVRIGLVSGQADTYDGPRVQSSLLAWVRLNNDGRRIGVLENGGDSAFN